MSDGFAARYRDLVLSRNGYLRNHADELVRSGTDRNELAYSGTYFAERNGLAQSDIGRRPSAREHLADRGLLGMARVGRMPVGGMDHVENPENPDSCC